MGRTLARPLAYGSNFKLEHLGVSLRGEHRPLVPTAGAPAWIFQLTLVHHAGSFSHQILSWCPGSSEHHSTLGAPQSYNARLARSGSS